MKKAILVFFVLACSYTVAFAQDPSEGVIEMGDTLVIPNTFNENPLDAINEWILWDHEGDLGNPQGHSIYKLLRGKNYLLTNRIQIDGRLSIVADKPDLENKPPQIVISEKADGTFTRLMFAGGPFTFKNIWWSHLNITSLTNPEFGLMGELLVDSTTTIFDGCYFEHIRGVTLKIRGVGNNVFVTNCFHNDSGREHNKAFHGHFINCEAVGQDSIVFRNTTMINTPGNFINARKQMVKYVEIDHCTIVNTVVPPLFSTFWIEAKFTNNLLMNAGSFGEDEFFRTTQEADAHPWSIFNIDTLANEWALYDSTWLDRESDRSMEISHNYVGWDDNIEAFWAGADTIDATQITNARTDAMFADDANYPHLSIENTFTKATHGWPEFITPLQDPEGLLEYISTVLWGEEPGFRYVWEPEGAEIPNFDLDWPPLEDLRVAEPIIGSDGLPLGDLNWYTNKAERWDMTGWGRGPTPTDISEYEELVPGSFSLQQNYPNPFNPVTTIEYKVGKAGLVKVSVFSLLGQEVEVIVNTHHTTGTHLVTFDASKFSSGVYFYKIEAGNFVKTRKMLVLK